MTRLQAFRRYGAMPPTKTIAWLLRDEVTPLTTSDVGRLRAASVELREHERAEQAALPPLPSETWSEFPPPRNWTSRSIVMFTDRARGYFNARLIRHRRRRDFFSLGEFASAWDGTPPVIA